MLQGFGAANFVGTLLAGWLLVRSPRGTMVLMPALVGIAALALVLLPASVPCQAMLLALWGLAFGGVPVAWSNWVARAVPDQAESAGGMVVASVQSAIAAGAAAGGRHVQFQWHRWRICRRRHPDVARSVADRTAGQGRSTRARR